MRIVTRRRPAAAQDTPCVVALGYFDGMHKGHEAVLAAAKKQAQERALRLAVFTFSGAKRGAQGKSLLLPRQKHRLLRALGVEACYEPPFESFCALGPEDFVGEMLAGEYNAQAVFCGENFTFGAQRAGNVPLLRRLCAAHGMVLGVAPTALFKGRPVSSSRIRTHLQRGDIPAVNSMLGRPYEIDLPVRHGRGLGGALGFPTANQIFPAGLLPPAFGVYATQTRIGGKAWPSVTGWGARPTVEESSAPTCETFIPGYSGDLYGKRLAVRFFEKIDEVRKFASPEELARAVRAWAEQVANRNGKLETGK